MNPKEFDRWASTLFLSLIIWLLAAFVSFLVTALAIFRGGPFWIFLLCGALNCIIVFALTSGWWVKPWKDFPREGN